MLPTKDAIGSRQDVDYEVVSPACSKRQHHLELLDWWLNYVDKENVLEGNPFNFLPSEPIVVLNRTTCTARLLLVLPMELITGKSRFLASTDSIADVMIEKSMFWNRSLLSSR